eukprot:gene1110-4338_t
MVKDSYEVNPAPSGQRTRTASSTHTHAVDKPEWNSQKPLSPTDEQLISLLTTRIGIYGWRKYCLYLMVLLLVTLAIINLGMLVFVFRVLNLDEDSAGPLHFHSDRLLVRGRAEFTQGILTSKISGFDNATLRVETNQQIILKAVKDTTGGSTFIIDGTELRLGTPRFSLSHENETYFSSTTERTEISSNEVKVDASAGMRVSGTIQTSHISNSFEDGAGLTLESVGQQLHLAGSENVTLESETNSVKINALQGINLNAEQGNVIFRSQNLQLRDLPTEGAGPTYFLCMCNNGRLFRVNSAQSCDQGAPSFC